MIPTSCLDPTGIYDVYIDSLDPYINFVGCYHP